MVTATVTARTPGIWPMWAQRRPTARAPASIVKAGREIMAMACPSIRPTATWSHPPPRSLIPDSFLMLVSPRGDDAVYRMFLRGVGVLASLATLVSAGAAEGPAVPSGGMIVVQHCEIEYK